MREHRHALADDVGDQRAADARRARSTRPGERARRDLRLRGRGIRRGAARSRRDRPRARRESRAASTSESGSDVARLGSELADPVQRREVPLRALEQRQFRRCRLARWSREPLEARGLDAPLDHRSTGGLVDEDGLLGPLRRCRSDRATSMIAAPSRIGSPCARRRLLDRPLVDEGAVGRVEILIAQPFVRSMQSCSGVATPQRRRAAARTAPCVRRSIVCPVVSRSTRSDNWSTKSCGAGHSKGRHHNQAMPIRRGVTLSALPQCRGLQQLPPEGGSYRESVSAPGRRRAPPAIARLAGALPRASGRLIGEAIATDFAWQRLA